MSFHGLAPAVMLTYVTVPANLSQISRCFYSQPASPYRYRRQCLSPLPKHYCLHRHSRPARRYGNAPGYFVSAVTVNSPDTTNSVRVIPNISDNPCGMVVNTGCCPVWLPCCCCPPVLTGPYTVMQPPRQSAAVVANIRRIVITDNKALYNRRGTHIPGPVRIILPSLIFLVIRFQFCPLTLSGAR